MLEFVSVVVGVIVFELFIWVRVIYICYEKWKNNLNINEMDRWVPG